ncbi:MAG: hypothetical protein KDN20_18435 [Verrucomicrobiae bacterium]|nr:hypothetical protein [Verrucomicrobiae bacterium]
MQRLTRELSQQSKDQYVEKMRWRYQNRGREGKSKLLDELVKVCGLSGKHAIKLMNPPVGSTVGRTETRGYDKPRAPADRMLEWEGISREKAAWLRKQKRELNPFERQEQVETALKQTFWSVLQPDVEMDWEEALQVPKLPPDRPSASLIDRSPTAPGLFVQPKADQALTTP